MPSLSIKAYYKNQIRRFHVECDDDGRFGYQRILNKIHHLFPNLDNGALKLTWKDSDGEFVLISNNGDLKEALANLPADGILRIHLLDADKPQMINPENNQEEKQEKVDNLSEQEPKPEEPSVDPTLHRNVVCDGCSGPIRVIRFKCLTCPDYDLCAECVGKVGHNEHAMLRITNPNDETWKQAFIASQMAASIPDMFRGHGFGFGRCHGGRCRPHAAHGCRRQQAAEGEKKEEEGATSARAADGPAVNEEVVRELTNAMETVFNIFGMPSAPKSHARTSCCHKEEAAQAVTDKKVQTALEYMLAMGYHNDDGRLEKLLKEAKGDVSAVLNHLHK